MVTFYRVKGEWPDLQKGEPILYIPANSKLDLQAKARELGITRCWSQNWRRQGKIMDEFMNESNVWQVGSGYLNIMSDEEMIKIGLDRLPNTVKDW